LKDLEFIQGKTA